MIRQGRALILLQDLPVTTSIAVMTDVRFQMAGHRKLISGEVPVFPVPTRVKAEVFPKAEHLRKKGALHQKTEANLLSVEVKHPMADLPIKETVERLRRVREDLKVKQGQVVIRELVDPLVETLSYYVGMSA
jgi:hypothetical protein